MSCIKVLYIQPIIFLAHSLDKPKDLENGESKHHIPYKTL